ncbi:MAG TPA: hypothetical protein VIL63_02710, partial [Terriglobales bacterium]
MNSHFRNVVRNVAYVFRNAIVQTTVLLSVLSVCVFNALSQQPTAVADTRIADPQINAALQQISARQIQSDIDKLVSFQTRSTISAQDPASISAGKGIGAAREWIKAEFERYSRDCGGCLEVKTDSFTQPVSERVPEPTVLTNVYAVLKGTNPSSSSKDNDNNDDAKRVVLVTGHYDSRNS